MTIPRGVNQIDFVQKALEKGIKIQSIYEGVYLYKNTNQGITRNTLNPKTYVSGYVWMAGLSKLSKNKRFPLTEEGELQAHKQYLIWKKSLNPSI